MVNGYEECFTCVFAGLLVDDDAFLLARGHFQSLWAGMEANDRRLA